MELREWTSKIVVAAGKMNIVILIWAGTGRV
jgi:hypothetical protein